MADGQQEDVDELAVDPELDFSDAESSDLSDIIHAKDIDQEEDAENLVDNNNATNNANDEND